MTNEKPRQKLGAAKENTQSNSSFEKLRVTLKNYSVIDKQGELIGVVQDLILEPNHQINFVISQKYGEQSSRLFLLISKLVKKVNRLNQSVILDINKAETNFLPEYKTTEIIGMETPEIDKSVTPTYEADDEDLTKNIDIYTSTTPGTSAEAPEENDIDIASLFDLTSTDMQAEAMLDSNVDFSAIPKMSNDTDNSSDFTSVDTPQDINLDRDVEFSTMPTAMDDMDDDIDITPLFDITAADTQEDTMLDSDVDLLGTPYSVESAAIQQQLDESEIAPETPEVLEEELIRLLGERVIVNQTKRKVGEVIVRKEIETRMVEVPVRWEKLVIEQVSPERKQLAEIDLGQEEISGIELNEKEITETKLSGISSLSNELTVRGEFNSPKIASLLLNAIALERRQGCKKVRVEIVVEDAERQKTYQEWINRASGNKDASNL